jgi:hypothetical protein
VSDGRGEPARRPDQSALLVPVPEAEPAVRAWRAQFDPAAAAGVPAHVTLLYPFLDREDIDDGDIIDLREHLASARAVDFTLARVERIGRGGESSAEGVQRSAPGVVYLAPERAAPHAGGRRRTRAACPVDCRDGLPAAPRSGG